MKPKFFISFITAIMLAGAATQSTAAQTAVTPPERGVYFELGAAIAQHVRYSFDPSKKYDRPSYGVILPGIGYKINQLFNVGVNLGIEVGENRYHLSPKPIFYGQYNFFRTDRLNIFVEPKLSFAKYIEDLLYVPYPGYKANFNKWLIESGISFGLNYALTNRLSFQLRYIQIGYSHAPSELYPEYNHSSGCIGNGRWIADFGLRRLELSLRYTFPNASK